jgi:dihydrolipoamide dehydrogenase
MQKHIAIIGGGPGGYVAAIRGAQLGAKITLIEKHKMGGNCLNYGCIPTKALYQSASYFKSVTEMRDFGIHLGDAILDMAGMMNKKQSVVKELVTGVEQLLKRNGVEVLEGEASFLDGKTLRVMGKDKVEQFLTPDYIVIATGSETIIPNIKGVTSAHILTSQELLDIKALPKSVTIVGGGVIGMEFAGIFSALGTEVTVIEALDQILTGVDSELVKRFSAGLKKQGIKVHKATKALEIKRLEKEFEVVCQDKKGLFSVNTDQILMAVGRKPKIGGLNLDQADIEYTLKGIEVNEHFVTNSDHIYAIGDVIGGKMLAHVASHQAITAIEHMLLGEKSTKASVVPACIFVFPEIATVGVTEDDLIAEQRVYKKSKFMMGANGKALTLGKPEGLVKVLTNMEDEIVGVHIMGAHASDLIHEATLAVNEAMSVDTIKEMIHAHPTLSEAFHEAVLGIKGEAIHMAPYKK